MYLGNFDITDMFSEVTTFTNVMNLIRLEGADTFMVSLVVFSSESIVH